MRSGFPATRWAFQLAVVACALALLTGVVVTEGRELSPTDPSLSAAQIDELTDPWAGQVHALAFGDSYFTGSDGVTRSQTFGRIALNGLGYTVTQSGHGGTGYVVESRVDGWPDFVSQVSDSALGELPVPPISVVLLEGGVNDALSNVPAALIRTNAAWVMASLRDRYPLAKHVVLGVPPDRAGRLTGPRAAINVAIRAAALATRWTFVDMRQFITPATGPTIIGPDRLHPTLEGHRKLASMLSERLAPLGVGRVPTQK
ncbi:SGNH/GDSL hydrolase family protein [Williamsia herbipolensis]|uniref:SGNH/GDSL hydrolase family protein n=1 Tax=Williamsia herbipolensis TaxID=1603258 RepID=UPI0005F7F9E0|nr:SGNH/GDSL hydrolase family protein [Williamsia herbipolensis]